MMNQERNDEITRIGPGTPAGRVMRSYWLPAALAVELEGERPVIPVTLLGERLVLFRDLDGDLGLLERHCPHRGADLCYARLENSGIRCAFHGWSFDRQGQCLEQPAEPPESTMHEKIRTTAYPVVEKAGIVWAYMGDGEPPAFPAFDCFIAPASHVFAFKGLWECNWLQALEVGIDPAHASFLHRFLQDEDPDDSYGKQFRDRAPGSDVPLTSVLRDYDRPRLEVEETDYGLRIVALRDLGDSQMHVRVTNQVFPCAITIPMSSSMNITQWHVPIDDENCYWYSIFTSFGEPVDHETMRAQRLRQHTLPDYAPIRNKHNNYGYDAKEQATLTYTGMGMDINVHDQWACESMGAIQDRSREHLASTDVAISRYRRMLRRAIKMQVEGARELPLVVDAAAARSIRGPVAIDSVAPADDWHGIWDLHDRERRNRCSWDAGFED
jgi:phenylpropionate dioxygenase-like ring-hydroxylating dioxygenase large terminal subunit